MRCGSRAGDPDVGSLDASRRTTALPIPATPARDDRAFALQFEVHPRNTKPCWNRRDEPTSPRKSRSGHRCGARDRPCDRPAVRRGGRNRRRRRDLDRPRPGDRRADRRRRRGGSLRRDRRLGSRELRARDPGDGDFLRRAARAAQQRRRVHRERRPRHRRVARRMVAGDQPESLRHLPRLPFRHPGDRGERRWLGDQHGVERGHDRHRRS